ncbi:MAG: hypothetical protein WC119_01630 [Synergistaceae bacterium]
MLKPAILYKDALPSCFAIASMNPLNRFVQDTYWNFSDLVSDSQWNSLEFVSVDHSDNIIGILRVTIDRGAHFVYAMMALRFEKDGAYDIAWAKDFKDFFVLLFGYYNFNKIDFEVCIGSPHEIMYDRFCANYGGRIVGTKKKHFCLTDGTIHDIKMYEVSRYDFISAIGEEKWKKLSMSKVMLLTPKERGES